jgi:antitoxin Phd
MDLNGIRMNSWNYSNARAQLSTLMDQAAAGCPVEITRRGREPAVIISKSSYEAYKKAEFDTAYLKKNASNEKI